MTKRWTCILWGVEEDHQGRDGRGDGVLVRQRDWPWVGERKAQPADIELKRRLLLEYFLEKQSGYAVSLVEFSDIKYFCNYKL